MRSSGGLAVLGGLFAVLVLITLAVAIMELRGRAPSAVARAGPTWREWFMAAVERRRVERQARRPWVVDKRVDSLERDLIQVGIRRGDEFRVVASVPPIDRLGLIEAESEAVAMAGIYNGLRGSA